LYYEISIRQHVILLYEEIKMYVLVKK